MNDELKQHKDEKKIQQHQQEYWRDEQGQCQGPYVGKYIVLLWDSNGEPRITIGPHWYVFVSAFLILNVFLVYILGKIQHNLSEIWFIILMIVSVISMGCYLAVGLSYPGFAKKIEFPTEEEQRSRQFCQICKTFQKRQNIRRIYHCSSCQICIEGYDHHCPWIGKCVGSKNICYFYSFILSIFVSIIVLSIGIGIATD